MWLKYFLVVLLFLIGCQNYENEIFLLETSSQNSGESNLFISENGDIYLSWVEYLNDTTDALLYSKLENNQWTAPKEIIRGSNWFVNWADFPSIVVQENEKNMVAHWLQKSATGTYDYDVRVIQSKNGGENWEGEFIIHRDSIAAEHGFVTMLPLANNRFFATWLDGRNTKIEEEENTDNHGHGHGGAMTLRIAEFDENGNIFEEAELDNQICDCCQTDAAMTDKGTVVVYRDRSEHEIRDISIVRKIDGTWTKPHSIHADNWEISGCPVNGPAIDAVENQAVVAWFTAANNKPSVKLAFSNDSGASFGNPIIISENAPLGRVDVVLINEGEAVISWLEETEKGASIFIKKANSAGVLSDDILIAKTDASRQSGFPIMKKRKDELIFSWTEVDSLTKVKTGVFFFNN